MPHTTTRPTPQYPALCIYYTMVTVQFTVRCGQGADRVEQTFLFETGG